MTDSDRVVLGGLVEGSWPPESRNDAWLSRPMRLALGLDLPERRVGLSAHDFAQALGAREVILSHAAKIAGGPTVPSRFVQRLAAIAGPRWEPALARGRTYLAWARELDRPQQVTAAPQPAPKPPRAARPSQLSVTAIEDWLRDPYTIYAKYILRLMPLDPVDLAPGAAERGTIIHAAVGEFTQRYAEALPSDPARVLIEIGRPYFAPLEDFPETSAFWWPRFVRIAHWLAGWEAQRRPGIKTIAAEVGGKIDIPLTEGAFTLSCRADRIERHTDGGYVILDYKTGSARSEKQVRAGLAPQLTLEAAILRRGGFDGIAAGSSVTKLGYVLLKGGAQPGEPKLINFLKGTTDEQADYALQDSPVSPDGSPNRTRRTARSFIRCGRAITAITIISPASRNGRRPAARWTTSGAANENARRHSRRGAAQAKRSVRSRHVGVGCRQRWRRQDPCSGPARDQPAAQWRRT